MLWIDIKFANMLSTQLEQFKIKSMNPFTANFRCPICGDSQRNRRKARGYLYQKNQAISYRCHNCQAGMSFKNFLKAVNMELFGQYNFDNYKETGNNQIMITPVMNIPEFAEKNLLDELMTRLDHLDRSHPAVGYIIDQRKMPDRVLSQLYHIDNAKDLENLSEKQRNKIKTDEPRIVVPFYNRNGQLSGVQARDYLNLTDLRYISVRLNENERMLFNIDKVDRTKTCYVLEGMFDAMLVENAVAVATSDLLVAKPMLFMADTVYVFDNQPRNREIVSLVRHAVNSNEHVVIWPENLPGKDINELVEHGYTEADVMKLLREHTYKGLLAKAKFAKWNKL